jgi:hypothetical protein
MTCTVSLPLRVALFPPNGQCTVELWTLQCLQFSSAYMRVMCIQTQYTGPTFHPYFPPSQLCTKQINVYIHFRPVFLLASFSGIYVA